MRMLENFTESLAAFHSPAPVPAVGVASLGYVAALMLTLQDGGAVHNLSLGALDHLTPDAAAFTAAYNTFHSAAPEPIVPVGDVPYIAALLVSLSQPGASLHNISLTAIDHMVPDAVVLVGQWVHDPLTHLNGSAYL